MPTPCVLFLYSRALLSASKPGVGNRDLKREGQTDLVWPFRLTGLPGSMLRRQGYPPLVKVTGGFVLSRKSTGFVIMHTSRGGIASSDCRQLATTVKISASVRTDLKPNRASRRVDLQRLPSIRRFRKNFPYPAPKRYHGAVFA